MNEQKLKSLAFRLLEKLEFFVETDGDTSYISEQEKEDQYHIKDARSLIYRAREALDLDERTTE